MMKDKKLEKRSPLVTDLYFALGAGALMFTAVVGMLSYLVVVDE